MPENILKKKGRPGIKFDKNGVARVAVWAPLLNRIELVLADSDKRLPLHKTEYGYWQLQTDELKPGDLYWFLLDDKGNKPDPASLLQPQGVHGPSQAVDLESFEWKDMAFQNPKLDDYIIYELHTGTFTEAGDFEGIITRLDHLKELGINAIEIMPVAQFPGNRNWGYDGAFPYATQNSYGGARGLMELVDACHQKGLAVILDVVYNHMGPEGNYFDQYGPYFTDKYHTPWGNAINFDDAWSDGVREYFVENAIMWFRDFHIDALRMDAVHAIKDLGHVHILQEIRQRVDELMLETDKAHYLIVELDLNDPRFIDPMQKNGYGMDAQWIDEFHHALRVTVSGDKTGYYSDFDGIADLAKSYRDAYVYDGIWSQHRSKVFGIKADDNPGRQFIVFSQNHDQVGNRMLGDRSSQLFNFNMQKLMVGAVMVSPYLPMLFMGEEWSAQTPFQYFVSHTDPELVKAVREGRKAEFNAFHTEEEAPDPQAVETFNNSKLKWDELKKASSQVMFDFYKTLIALRRELPALHTLDRKSLETIVNETANTLTLHRWAGQQHICCVMNFSKQEQQMEMPDGNWKKILDSADEKWIIEPSTNKAPETGIIRPESIIIYGDQHV